MINLVFDEIPIAVMRNDLLDGHLAAAQSAAVNNSVTSLSEFVTKI